MTEYDEVIPPGSEGKIQASVDISHLKGPIQKSVDFSTNDPAHPQAQISIKAIVKTHVNVEPEVVRFMLNKGEPASQELTLTTESPMKLSNAVINSEYFSVSMQSGASKNQYKMKVSVKENVPIGITRAEVRITADGPQKQITIPVNARVLGPLRVEPTVVNFVVRGYPDQVTTVETVDIKQAPDLSATLVKKMEPGNSLRVLSQNEDWYQVVVSEKISSVKNASGKQVNIPSRVIGWVKKVAVKSSKGAGTPEPLNVSVQSATGRGFKLLDYQSTDPDVKVVLQPNGGVSGYQFKVSLLKVPANKNKKAIQSRIIVRTDNAEQPEVNIPVFITIT